MSRRKTPFHKKIDKKIHDNVESNVEYRSDLRHVGAVIYSKIYLRMGDVSHVQLMEVGKNNSKMVLALKEDLKKLS
jgi:hypothetical protein